MKIKNIEDGSIEVSLTSYDCDLLSRALDESLGEFIRIGQESDYALIEAMGTAFKAIAIASDIQSNMKPSDLTSLVA